MPSVGIEAINVFGGSAYINVKTLAEYRQLNMKRFNNLLIKEKAIAIPTEDPVTYAVNAAKPIMDALSSADRDSIELVITCTESGIDFGKSLSTYVHHYLELNKNCRLFEIKQACYSGTAGLQMAANFILSKTSPDAKALVITSDVSRFILDEGHNPADMDWSFTEPSSGAGAVAMLISNKPNILKLDVGASGYYGYEVMDTCRPMPESESGNSDLSLMSYLDCCQNTFIEYQRRVENADYQHSFSLLSFHTPFGGIVKGAHRTMMRRLCKAKPEQIVEDYQRRVEGGIQYCQRVGNIMGGTLYLSLVSTIDHARIETPQRIGLFSYGSGCCSEFYSGIVTSLSHQSVQAMQISQHLSSRYQLNMDEYSYILQKSALVKFGVRSLNLPKSDYIYIMSGQPNRLYLQSIDDFHRTYEWS